LSYVMLEKENVAFSTVARYPKGKWVMAEPLDTRCVGLLPVFDADKDQIVAAWNDIVARAGVEISLGEMVEKIRRSASGAGFEVKTARRTLRAQRVVIATGTRGRPRKLGVPGEDLSKVHNLLEDPDAHARRDVLVVGGGDSAAEAAIALAAAGARVTLSYRGQQLARVNMKNREKLDKLIASKKVRALFGSQVAAIQERAVDLRLEGGRRQSLPNQDVILLIGADPPIEWLKATGVQYVERPHMQSMPRSDELVERLLGPVEETKVDNVLELVSGREPPAWAAAPRTVTVDVEQIIGERPMPSLHTPPRAELPGGLDLLPLADVRAFPQQARSGTPTDEPQDYSWFAEPTRAIELDPPRAARLREPEPAAAAPSKVDLRAISVVARRSRARRRAQGELPPERPANDFDDDAERTRVFDPPPLLNLDD